MPSSVAELSVAELSAIPDLPSGITRDLAITRIQEGLGFRTDRATTIANRLIEAQRDIERGKTLPPFMRKEGAILNLARGTQEVFLPNDFLRLDTGPLFYNETNSNFVREIPWKSYREAVGAYAAADPAGPKIAVKREFSILFYPIADRDYSITWSYYRKADPLTSNIQNLWLAFAPELIIGEAGLRIAMDMRNQTAVQLFTQMKGSAKASWFSESVLEEQQEDQCLGANN